MGVMTREQFEQTTTDTQHSKPKLVFKADVRKDRCFWNPLKLDFFRYMFSGGKKEITVTFTRRVGETMRFITDDQNAEVTSVSLYNSGKFSITLEGGLRKRLIWTTLENHEEVLDMFNRAERRRLLDRPVERLFN